MGKLQPCQTIVENGSILMESLFENEGRGVKIPGTPLRIGLWRARLNRGNEFPPEKN